MISGVSVEVHGRTIVLRLTTRAMMALEQAFDQSVDQVFASLQGNPRISTLVKILAESMDDGKGAPVDMAAEMVDALGFERVGEILEEVATKAFPEAAEKNQQGAGRKK